MSNFFKRLFGKKEPEIQFISADDIIMQCSALHGQQRHSDAIALFEKYVSQLRQSETYVVGLTNIVKICNEINDTARLVKYARELKVLEPTHPWVIELSKHYSL